MSLKAVGLYTIRVQCSPGPKASLPGYTVQLTLRDPAP